MLKAVHLLPLCLALGAMAQTPGIEFFEKNIRPVLVKNCHQCHGPSTEHAGLRLDSRTAMLKGGTRGPSITPGQPGASLLLKALRHEGLKMPQGGKLKPEEIAAFDTWIASGAPWPTEAVSSRSTKSMAERAADYWALRPVTKPSPPSVVSRDWPRTPIDSFLLSALEKAKLAPAPTASRNALLRRVTFDLTGLPPKPEEVASFLSDTSPDAYNNVVDRLLKSTRFGEHWARHWMDLVRYSESHGSQGDFDLPQAWRYRDYLIRALNNDVPYDQLVREHLAGDLLPAPRINNGQNTNESVIGTAHFRMVEYGYVPVDALDDQFKVVDNQIDVISKAFQGLTVSCARCHDHKFDPISQKDFYSLYGILASSRHGQRAIDTPAHLNRHRAELIELRQQLRGELGRLWLQAKPDLSANLPQAPDKKTPPDYGPLTLWRALKDPVPTESFAERWERAAAASRQDLEARRQFNAKSFRRVWNLSQASDYNQWFRAGNGLPDAPSKPGEFYVLPETDRLVNGVYQAGVYSHLLSRKHSATLHSPRFKIESGSISIRVLGGDVASARIVVENYALGNGGIFPATVLNDDAVRWIRFDTKYRRGSYAYIELTPFEDRSRLAGNGPKDGRSHFGLAEVVFHDGNEPPKEEIVPAALLLEGPAPASLAQLAGRYQSVLQHAVAAWIEGSMTDRHAAYLDFFVRNDLLPNSKKQVPAALVALVDKYRRLEAEIPVPRRSPAFLAGTAFDQPLFLRGNHMSPGPPVPRRYLEALGAQPCASPESGRLELAAAITSPANPLTARVMVNRLWHHLYGRGLVRTVDNFGKNGEKPTHPELLDYLAARFVEVRWSIKSMIRLMVTSNAYQLSSTPSAEAAKLDSDNTLLQHARRRRLTAESIRDSILAVSGELDGKLYGPGIDIYYTGKTEGGGKVGPLDGARRRSVYQRIKRNAQNPFLEVFDSPKPTSTRGQRDSTNVPAQSLTMLNNPFVIDQASKWAGRILADGGTSVPDRVERMFLRALGRRPSPAELANSLDYLAQSGTAGVELLGNQQAWQDFAHSIFNLKEFLYLQ